MDIKRKIDFLKHYKYSNRTKKWRKIKGFFRFLQTCTGQYCCLGQSGFHPSPHNAISISPIKESIMPQPLVEPGVLLSDKTSLTEMVRSS